MDLRIPNLGYWGMGNDSRQSGVGARRGPTRLSGGVGGGPRIGRRHGPDQDRRPDRQIDIGISNPPAGHLPTRRRPPQPSTPSLAGASASLGVSARRVSEGWHGVRFGPKPLARTREYITIVEKALSRERLRSTASSSPSRCRTAQTDLDRPPGARPHPHLPRCHRPQEP